MKIILVLVDKEVYYDVVNVPFIQF